MTSNKKDYGARIGNWDDAKMLRALGRVGPGDLETLVTSYSPRAEPEIHNQFLLAANTLYNLKTISEDFEAALTAVDLPIKPDVKGLRANVASFARQMFVLTYTCGTTINVLNKQMKDQLDKHLETIRTNQELYKQVMTDPLTGLYSRRFFFTALPDRIKQAEKHNELLSIILLDINEFKKVNDTYGHAGGDFTLKAMAQYARSTLPKAYVVARLGGDEFGIIVPKADEQTAFDIAETLRKGIEQKQFVYTVVTDEAETDYGINTTIALGVKQREQKESEDELCRGADAAFYVAHKLGKNRTVKYTDFLIHYQNMPAEPQTKAKRNILDIRPRKKIE